MDVNETLQRDWGNLSERDKKSLLKRIGRGKVPIISSADDIDPETYGRLILALRDGKPGFSIKEFHRGKDAYQIRQPNRLIQMVRGVSYKLDRLLHPNLHD